MLWAAQGALLILAGFLACPGVHWCQLTQGISAVWDALLHGPLVLWWACLAGSLGGGRDTERKQS